ncbi:succinate dehydrogenase, cytochrome b556 subunit, partial [Pseudoduganella namucuonensis]
MSEAVKEVPRKERPQFRNIHITELSNYRLPLAGVVSILHRISGFLMFALLPVILYLFEKSIVSEISFEH